jgi:hemerythrin-like domain-containing protein
MPTPETPPTARANTRAADARSAAALSRLQREHANIGRLLALLESELARLHGGQDVDDALILDAFTYLTDYVDRVHHPREDLANEMLAARSTVMDELRPVIAAQHATIRDSGASLRDRLERALQDQPVARLEIARDGFVYTRELRRNMELEEAVVFAVASALLTGDDWAVIDAKVAPEADPLFGDAVDARFVELSEELTERAGCSWDYE